MALPPLSHSLQYVTNRLWLIFCIYAVTMLMASSLFAVLEHHRFIDGLWWATATSLTIGYGDITPKTDAGKWVGIVFGHVWFFLIAPMVIANLTARLLQNRNLFTDHEQRWMMGSLEKIADRLGLDLDDQPNPFESQQPEPGASPVQADAGTPQPPERP